MIFKARLDLTFNKIYCIHKNLLRVWRQEASRDKIRERNNKKNNKYKMFFARKKLKGKNLPMEEVNSVILSEIRYLY